MLANTHSKEIVMTQGRYTFLAASCILALMAAFGLLLLPPAVSASVQPDVQPDTQTPRASVTKKPLVVYFSRSGNTRKIAEAIHKKVGGDIIEIETVEAYPEDYNATTKLAKQEQEQRARPAIKTKIPNLEEYGVIFLGYPNWWSSMPMPVFTFIEQGKLDGATIAPFMTHGGGGAGHSVDDLRKAVPHSKVLKPLVISGKAAANATADIITWIEGLGPALIETSTGAPAIYPDGAK